MTQKPWQADIEVTDGLVHKLLEQQFPELMPIEFHCVGEGWDNKAYLVDHENEQYIFRFPRRKVAIELIERENKILSELQNILNVPIPNPIFMGLPTSFYPYVFHGYKKIKGISACHSHLSPEQRRESLLPIASFLKKLHGIHEQEALALGAKSQIFDRTLIDRISETLRERVNMIVERKLCHISIEIVEQEIEQAKKIVLSSNKCLIHGDLYCRHLLFDKGKLSGIIDWGDVGINSPAVDLSLIWSFYPKEDHQTFFDIYGVVDPPTWQYARFLALYGDILLILYAIDTEDALLVDEAIDSANRINADLNIRIL